MFLSLCLTTLNVWFNFFVLQFFICSVGTIIITNIINAYCEVDTVLSCLYVLANLILTTTL